MQKIREAEMACTFLSISICFLNKEIFIVYSKYKKSDKFKLYFEKLKDNYYKAQKNKLIKELKNITKF